MEGENEDIVYVIPVTVLRSLVDDIRKLGKDVLEIKRMLEHNSHRLAGYIRPVDFMNAVGIKRTKFNALVANSTIKTVKKGRKIYVPFSEVERYFNDPKIS